MNYRRRAKVTATTESNALSNFRSSIAILKIEARNGKFSNYNFNKIIISQRTGNYTVTYIKYEAELFT